MADATKSKSPRGGDKETKKSPRMGKQHHHHTDQEAAHLNFRKPVVAPPNMSSEPGRDLPVNKVLMPGYDQRHFTDTEIKEAFDTFDLDKNKFVGAAEIRHILALIGETATDEEIDEMIRMCDNDGDGQVTFDEFHKVISEPPLPAPPVPGKLPTAEEARRKYKEAEQEPLSPQMKKTKMPGASDGAATGTAGAAADDPMTQLIKDFSGGEKMKPQYIKKIYKKFQMVDKDGSGRIDYEEFLTVCGHEDTPMARKLFRMFDLDNSGTVELKEFITVLSRYTAATKTDKLKFAFMMFDEDGSGYIDRGELKKIMQANFVSEQIDETELNHRCDQIFRILKLETNGQISYENFMTLAQQNAGLVYPIQAATKQLGNQFSINTMLKGST